MIATVSTDERSAGRKVPAFYYPDPTDTATCITFDWCGPHQRNVYDVRLERRYSRRPWHLGAIEWYEKSQCWYIIEIAKSPMPPAESFPFFSYTEAAIYLLEVWRERRERELACFN